LNLLLLLLKFALILFIFYLFNCGFKFTLVNRAEINLTIILIVMFLLTEIFSKGERFIRGLKRNQSLFKIKFIAGYINILYLYCGMSYKRYAWSWQAHVGSTSKFYHICLFLHWFDPPYPHLAQTYRFFYWKIITNFLGLTGPRQIDS